MLGKLGAGGLGARIAGWGSAVVHTIGEVVSVFHREGIVGGISEIVAGRRETFGGVQRKGALDALPYSRRPGRDLYTKTDLQLTDRMKADFDVEYIAPGETEAKLYHRSMLFGSDRTKRAIVSEFERRLQKDIEESTPTSGVHEVKILRIDFKGLEIRSDVDYRWSPDDAPW